jgi:hypothetical protein
MQNRFGTNRANCAPGISSGAPAFFQFQNCGIGGSLFSGIPNQR